MNLKKNDHAKNIMGYVSSAFVAGLSTSILILNFLNTISSKDKNGYLIAFQLFLIIFVFYSLFAIKKVLKDLISSHFRLHRTEVECDLIEKYRAKEIKLP